MKTVRIDYDTDVVKHLVRYEGWLHAVKERKKLVVAAQQAKKRDQGLTYFTFCASSAIDVFMLEKVNLLRRDPKTDRLKNVYFCEGEEVEFMKIANMIGSTDAGFMEIFEDFVLFQDDQHTRGLNEYDPSRPVPNAAEIRRKFNCKRMHRQFLELHPFDVINLDLYGNLFPPKGEVFSRMFETIEKVFEMQKRKSSVDEHTIDGFTLFLTVYVSKEDFNDQVIGQLIDTANDNMAHKELKAAFEGRYPHGDPGQLVEDDFPTFFSIILPKVVAELASNHGWFGSHKQIYLYGRQGKKGYHMMNSVVSYERLPDYNHLPGPKRKKHFLSKYIPEVAEIFRSMPIDVDARLKAGGQPLMEKISEHLAETIAFRDKRIAERGE